MAAKTAVGHVVTMEGGVWTPKTLVRALIMHARVLESTSMSDERWERATRVLVVDDNPTARFLCATALAPVFDVATAGNVDEALAALRQAPVDAVVVDLELGRDSRQDSVKLLEEVARSWPETRRIVFGGYETPDIAARVEHPAVQSFVRKAGPMGALVAAIRG